MAELALVLSLLAQPAYPAVATWYGGPYVGKPLYCGDYTYSPNTEPWVAVSSENADLCGHLLAIWTRGRDGQEHLTLARVLDVGPFGSHCVMQPSGACWPIAFDIPWHLWPHGGDLSAEVVRWTDITAEARQYVH